MIILCIVTNIIDPAYKYYTKIKYKLNSKIEERKLPIKNSKLNPIFIKNLNIKNLKNVDEKKTLECTICLDEIDLEKYKKKKIKLIFLDCSHVFHTQCLQPWIKSKVLNTTAPNCPLCRQCIVDIKEIKVVNYSYSYNSDYSDYSD